MLHSSTNWELATTKKRMTIKSVNLFKQKSDDNKIHIRNKNSANDIFYIANRQGNVFTPLHPDTIAENLLLQRRGLTLSDCACKEYTIGASATVVVLIDLERYCTVRHGTARHDTGPFTERSSALEE